jgi:hypothetical protein
MTMLSLMGFIHMLNYNKYKKTFFNFLAIFLMKKPDHRCKLVNCYKNKLKFISFTHVGRYLKYSHAIMNVALLVT